jgi:NADH:ubiquinone oxidoreductase subunit H
MNLINIFTTNKITVTNDNLIFNISNLLFGLVDVLFVLIPILLCVAFMTIIERKQLASFQRRVGPNTVG